MQRAEHPPIARTFRRSRDWFNWAFMGWRGQDNRDRDEEREWRKLPLRERYDWPSLALFVIFLVVFAYALWRGE
ncbi:MAG: hypothetical protein ACXW3V_00630 [Methylocystis sp.]